jgi:hypothetical protein
MYHPSAERDVVLNCGCVTTPHGATKLIGDKYEEQACEKHDGWYRILRIATAYERFAFYECGQPATKRASRKALAEVFGLPIRNSKHTDGSRNGIQTLF